MSKKIFSIKDHILRRKFAQELEEGENIEEMKTKEVPDIDQRATESGLIEAPGKKEFLQIPVEFWDQFINKLDNFNAQIEELKKNNIDVDPIKIIGKRDNGVFIEVQISYNDAKFGNGWQVVGLLEPQVETYDPNTGRVVSVFEKTEEEKAEDQAGEAVPDEVKSDLTVTTNEGQKVKLKRRYSFLKDEKNDPIHPTDDSGKPITNEFVYSNPVQQLSQDIQVPEYFSKMRPICQEKSCKKDILRVKLFIISKPYTRTAEEVADTEKGLVDKGREFLMVGSTCIWKFIPRIKGLTSPTALANMIKNISVALPKFLQSFKKQSNAAGGSNAKMNTPKGMRDYFAETGILTEFFLSKALPLANLYGFRDKALSNASKMAIKMCTDENYDKTMTGRVESYGKTLNEDDRALIDNAIAWARSIPKEQLKLFPERYPAELEPLIHSAATRRIITNSAQGKRVLTLIKLYKKMVQETKKYDVDTLGPIAQDKVNDFIMFEGTIDQGYPKAATFNIIDQLKDNRIKRIYRYRATETDKNAIPEVKEKISKPRVAEWEAEWDAEDALKSDRTIRVTGLVKSYSMTPDQVITNLTQVTPVDTEMYSENKEAFDNNLKRQIESYKNIDEERKKREEEARKKIQEENEKRQKEEEERKANQSVADKRNQDYVSGNQISGKFKILSAEQKRTQSGRSYFDAKVEDIINKKILTVWNDFSNPAHKIVQELISIGVGKEVELTGIYVLDRGYSNLKGAKIVTATDSATIPQDQAVHPPQVQPPQAQPPQATASKPARISVNDPDYKQGTSSADKPLKILGIYNKGTYTAIEWLDRTKNQFLSSVISNYDKILQKLSPVGTDVVVDGTIIHGKDRSGNLYVNINNIKNITPIQPAPSSGPAAETMPPTTIPPVPTKTETTASSESGFKNIFSIVPKSQFRNVFSIKNKNKKHRDERLEGDKLDTQLLCCGYPENRRKDPYKSNKKCACTNNHICNNCKIKIFKDSLIK